MTAAGKSFGPALLSRPPTPLCSALESQNESLQEEYNVLNHSMQVKDLELRYLDDRCG
jgi:hypothetical protein